MKKLNLNIQMFASTNKTANYDLPQFVGTDKPTWLGDFNEAMFDIDAGMHENATDIASVETVAENASSAASQASQDVAGLTSTVNTLSTNVSVVTQTANNAQQTATSALNTANTANGKADTNASAITGIQSDISNIESDISDIESQSEYSTNEKVIGKWIDGKPLYRKVYTQASKNNIDLSSLNFDFIELEYTHIIVGTASTYIRTPYFRNNTDYFDVVLTNTSLSIETNNASVRNWTVIIKYTKTTDTAS